MRSRAASYRRFSTYRGATFAGVFTNTVFGFLMAYVLLAVVHDAGGKVGGLDADAAVTYTFVAQGFLATVGAFGELGIGERIRTGDIVIDLYRPVDFQQYWLAQDLGRAAFQAIFRGVPPFLLGALVFDLQVPSSAGVWLAFAVSARPCRRRELRLPVHHVVVGLLAPRRARCEPARDTQW